MARKKPLAHKKAPGERVLFEENLTAQTQDEDYRLMKHLIPTKDERRVSFSNAKKLRSPRLIEATPQNVHGLVEIDPFLGNKTADEAWNSCSYTPQVEALARLLSGSNVFISGPAGSGKTSILKPFLSILEAEGMYEGIYFVAPTAVAASNLPGGMTIHAFGTFPSKWASKIAKIRIMATRVLIIDEVSMASAELLDQLDSRMREVRKSDKPFGGVQVVMLGDFMQLPPVEGEFCYFSQAWREANPVCLYLDRLYRAQDIQLKTVLDSLSSGELTDEVRDVLSSRVDTCHRNKDIPVHRDGKPYIRMFTTNANIDEYNNRQYSKLKGKELKVPTLFIDPKDSKRVLSQPIPGTTALTPYDNYSPEKRDKLKPSVSERFKIGTAVVNIKNNSYRVATMADDTAHIQALKDYEGLVQKGDFSKSVFSPNRQWVTQDLECYVANGDVGTVVGFNDESVIVKFNRLDSYVQVKYQMDDVHEEITPEVHTRMETERALLMEAGVENPKVEPRLAFRLRYLPLRHAYAISVHKSQGQTYDGAVMDLSNLFTPGLGYVAISRVRDIEGLIISDIDYDRVAMVDPNSVAITKEIRESARKNRELFLENVNENLKVLLDPETRHRVWRDRFQHISVTANIPAYRPESTLEPVDPDELTATTVNADGSNEPMVPSESIDPSRDPNPFDAPVEAQTSWLDSNPGKNDRQRAFVNGFRELSPRSKEHLTKTIARFPDDWDHRALLAMFVTMSPADRAYIQDIIKTL